MIHLIDQARSQVETWKQAGEKVVFTNGCFDVLHRGHVDLLSAAREMGDHLVVGLNSDQSVVRLKGPERPLQTEVDRAAILDALRSVDMVVIFEEDTPLELICTLKPDVLVKGGDYTFEQIVGAQEVVSRGGQVKIFPLVQGLSSSGILHKMNPK